LAAVAALLQVAAASPSPDLRQYLAPAPGTDWVDAPASPEVINGPFNAHDWAAYVDDAKAEASLHLYGFVTGYGLAWQQKVTKDFLEEHVFQFTGGRGARYLFDAFKVDTKTSKFLKREFSTWDANDVYGNEFAFDDGERGFSVFFIKGALLFEVNLYSAANDLTDKTLSIARGEFDAAPDATQLTSATQVLPQAAAWVIGLSLLALVLLIAGVILVLARRRPAPAAAALAAGGVRMSDDGSYWWDGVRWRSSATDVPPTAQRSADGAYWWDGRSWRRTGQ